MNKSCSNLDSVMAMVIFPVTAKKSEEENVNEKNDQWTLVQRALERNAKKVNL